MTGRNDPRIECMARAMIKYDEMSMTKTWKQLAEVALTALEEYYGASRYWMAAEFERERVLREIEQKVEEIRDANISS